MKNPAIYILTNTLNNVLYVGVTSDLGRRVYEHKNHLIDGFTKKYNCTILVYYEIVDSMKSAIAREKQLKSFSRKTKTKIIDNNNPAWKDLYDFIL